MQALDELITLSCAVAALRLDRETERKVTESAERLGVPISTRALALWFLGSLASTRYPGPVEDVLRFCDWLLSGRGSHI